MKFCDKLPKVRKNNNYSQEQLAEKLHVSRQAVSKWEMGVSYPDMDKLLQICKVLNCTLADLMDDGALGDTPTTNETRTQKFQTYFQEFLNFITKSYNMWCCLKLGGKLKLLLEMGGICLVLLIATIITGDFTRRFLDVLLGSIDNNFIAYLAEIVVAIVQLVALIISAVIALHLFRIRYLDYYVTIEDRNVKEKIIEQPVATIPEKPKAKVIIRDTNHSSWKIFDFLGKCLMAMLKLIVACGLALPAAIGFILAVVGIAASIYHWQYSEIFFWLIWLGLGGGLLCYTVLEWSFNFIFTLPQHLKRLFFLALVGAVGAGVGTIMPILIVANFTTIDGYQPSGEVVSTITTITPDSKTLLNCEGRYLQCEIEAGREDILVQLQYPKTVTATIDHEQLIRDYVVHELTVNGFDGLEAYQLLLQDLKNKQWRDYDYPLVKATAVMSQETYDLLLQNHETYDALTSSPNLRDFESL